jgi:hypothetical protein
MRHLSVPCCCLRTFRMYYITGWMEYLFVPRIPYILGYISNARLRYIIGQREYDYYTSQSCIYTLFLTGYPIILSTPSISNGKSLWLIWYIDFAMYLDTYILICSKIYVPKNQNGLQFGMEEVLTKRERILPLIWDGWIGSTRGKTTNI